MLVAELMGLLEDVAPSAKVMVPMDKDHWCDVKAPLRAMYESPKGRRKPRKGVDEVLVVIGGQRVR